jgi:hypothetical protein
VDNVNTRGFAACNVVSANIKSYVAKSASANLLRVCAAFSKPIHYGFGAYRYTFCYAGWKSNIVTQFSSPHNYFDKLKKGKKKIAKNLMAI